MSPVDVVILMGKPGAGKGTQAIRLAESVKLAHISTGDLFRENISQDTDLGNRAKGFMNEGKLVPDELVLDMLFDRVGRSDCTTGYILDGFPRTLVQAEALNERLNGCVSVEAKVSLEPNALRAIDIDVPDEIIVTRVAGRLLCRDCTNIQHKEFNPPSKPGVCDACSGELYQRKDDTAEAVVTRLAAYHEQTAPVAEYYRSRGVLQSIDGTQSPDSVFSSLTELFAEQSNKLCGEQIDRGGA